MCRGRISGIADYPGRDILHTLGGFDNEQGEPVGTRVHVGVDVIRREGTQFQTDARRTTT